MGKNLYAGKRCYTVCEGNELIKGLVCSETPFFVGKLGETELRTIYTFQNTWYRLNKIRITSYDICNNAGFFPRKIGAIYKFCDEYLDAMSHIDYLGKCNWENEEQYVAKYCDSLQGTFSNGVLDPLLLDDPWTSVLEGKRVLVIHPFAESINIQYSQKREHIFKDNSMILPKFELLTIKAVQSIGGKGAIGFNTWFSALEYMKKQIDNADFDIALLGCGAYGLELGAYIKSKDKQAIYMGGCLQLLFGILGKRWEKEAYVSRFVNQHWVRPMKQEKPYVSENIEGGCYW